MEDLWRKWGQPTSLALALFLVGLTTWRIHYGIDFLQEAENAIRILSFKSDQINSIEAFGNSAWSWLFQGFETPFLNHGVGTILELRFLQLVLVLFVVTLILFAFPSEVGIGSRGLFLAYLACFVPGGCFGVSNLTTASVLWAGSALVLLFLRQQVTAYRLWVLMFLLAGLVFLVPSSLVLFLLAPFWVVIFRDKDALSWRKKIQVFAIASTALIGLIFLIVSRESEQREVLLQSLGNVFAGPRVVDWSFSAPEGLLIFVFLLALLLALLAPARYFHGLFIALCLPFMTGGLLLPGAAVEAIVLFLAPLALSHIWRLRGTVFAVRSLQVFSVWLFLGGVIFSRIAGMQGLAIAVLPVLAVFFLSGWYRQLQWTGLASAVIFGLLIVISGFRTLPPGQSRFESLDRMDVGAWQGISTSRSQSLRMDAWQKTLAEIPTQAKHLWVQGDFPGFYLLLGPKGSRIFQGEDPSGAPDLVFIAKGVPVDLARRWEDREDYVLWTRKELETLPGQIWIRKNLMTQE